MFNYRHILFLAVLICLAHFTFSQNKTLVSHFTWEQDATTAIVGPNAVAISSSAYISADGQGGTYGLNAGLPKKNIDMELPSYLFDYDGIEVKIDFRRDENQGEFIRRSQDFIFGMTNGGLYIRYRVEDNAGGYTTEIGSNIYAIPNDGQFHAYRFCYLPDSGVARIWVDNSLIWENYTTANKPMYWNGSNPIFVGGGMDGTGRDNAVFDNLQIFGVNMSPAPLPIELISFKAVEIEKDVLIQWTTFTELNNDYFTIERSTDAMSFIPIGKVEGNKTSSQQHDYNFFDTDPLEGVSYYRLKQTDFDGSFSYSDMVAINRDEDVKQYYSIYPNPSKGDKRLTVNHLKENQEYKVVLYDATSQKLKEYDVISNEFGELEILPVEQKSGIYFIQLIPKGKTGGRTEKILVYN